MAKTSIAMAAHSGGLFVGRRHGHLATRVYFFPAQATRRRTSGRRQCLSPLRLSIARNLSRCHPQKTFEPVRQMTLVGVANCRRDVRDGDATKQQLVCALDSYVL